MEPGEAECTLDIVEQLFEYYFVGPAKAKRSRDAVNAKLAAAGRPALP